MVPRSHARFCEACGAPLQRRPPWRPSNRLIYSVLGTIVLVPAILIVGYWWFSSRTSPEAVARVYVTALADGDASAANSNVRVDMSAYASSGYEPTYRHLSPAHYSDVQVVSHSVAGDVASVTVAYRDARGSHNQALRLLRDHTASRYIFFPRWQVQVAPDEVTVAGPADNESVLVDGSRAGDMTGGSATFPILPGSHTITTSGSALFRPDRRDVSIPTAQSGPVRVSLHPGITTEATADARRVVQAGFQTCATGSNSSNLGCPQTSSCTCTWTIIADPLLSFALRMSQQGTGQGVAGFDAFGVFGMEGSEPNQNDLSAPVLHWSAGIYDASLTWTGTDFSLTGIQATPHEANPAGVRVEPPSQPTDSDILGAVRDAFGKCAADTSDAPSNCPQQTSCSATAPAPVTWTVVGDPVDPATTQDLFDTVTDSYQVTGTFTMTYSIGASCDGFSPPPTTGNVTGAWIANVAWDGKKLLVINIANLPTGSTSSS